MNGVWDTILRSHRRGRRVTPFGVAWSPPLMVSRCFGPLTSRVVEKRWQHRRPASCVVPRSLNGSTTVISALCQVQLGHGPSCCFQTGHVHVCACPCVIRAWPCRGGLMFTVRCCTARCSSMRCVVYAHLHCAQACKLDLLRSPHELLIVLMH